MAVAMGGYGEEYLELLADEGEWLDGLVLGTILPKWVWEPLPRPARAWLRNYIAGILLYLCTGFLWSFYIYYWKRNVYLLEDEIPSNNDILLQIAVSMKAMPLHSAFPTLSEYLIQKGWTRCFPEISNVGWNRFILYLCIYLVLYEFGGYWVHRAFHEIKPLYKYLHAPHHKYNKQNTLSPFAGLASHPLDGILLGVPHIITLFLLPTHFRTNMIFLLCESVWTANIHDGIHGNLWPFMGAGYHTIHHTTYHHNYGRFTIFIDWVFGTLHHPEIGMKKSD